MNSKRLALEFLIRTGSVFDGLLDPDLRIRIQSR